MIYTKYMVGGIYIYFSIEFRQKDFPMWKLFFLYFSFLKDSMKRKIFFFFSQLIIVALYNKEIYSTWHAKLAGRKIADD